MLLQQCSDILFMYLERVEVDKILLDTVECYKEITEDQFKGHWKEVFLFLHHFIMWWLGGFIQRGKQRKTSKPIGCGYKLQCIAVGFCAYGYCTDFS
ncbi:hypothetical protein MRB53_006291 [Persea americana]|uniref:Uncharacterized protein n=1 Tax=Persea americana TaxID=3435 RepID=A0ACC2MG05_PERAE|nr:hypothetical protein MRB53_006291 [Persea americana]